MGVNVTDKSGAAGVAFRVNQQLGDGEVDKRHPDIAKIRDWVDAQYNAGRTTAISHEEMMEQARKHWPGLFK